MFIDYTIPHLIYGVYIYINFFAFSSHTFIFFSFLFTAHEALNTTHLLVTMTGPGEGKLPLNAKVCLNAEELPSARVYIHLKGYSRATVTHLDIEHPKLNRIIPPKAKTSNLTMSHLINFI